MAVSIHSQDFATSRHEESSPLMTDYPCLWTLNSKYRGVNFTTESDEGRLIIDSSMRTR